MDRTINTLTPCDYLKHDDVDVDDDDDSKTLRKALLHGLKARNTSIH
jgi:hypothetical protein